jgi:hypothetical protein
VLINTLQHRSRAHSQAFSLSTHPQRSVCICALLVSADITTLVQCVPSIYDLFVTSSLFEPVRQLSSNVPELQRSYLQDAVIAFARQYDASGSSSTMERFDLGEITTLAGVWSMDLRHVHTIFLLAMYEFGKDGAVDELLTAAAVGHEIDVDRFVSDGVDIVCRRLDYCLRGGGGATGSGGSAAIRDVVSLLDADLCEWISHRASSSSSTLVTASSSSLVLSSRTSNPPHSSTLLVTGRPNLNVPIGSTHLLVLRLLSLASSSASAATNSSSQTESALRGKIHSLVVLAGILVKALSSDAS